MRHQSEIISGQWNSNITEEGKCNEEKNIEQNHQAHSHGTLSNYYQFSFIYIGHSVSLVVPL